MSKPKPDLERCAQHSANITHDLCNTCEETPVCFKCPRKRVWSGKSARIVHECKECVDEREEKERRLDEYHRKVENAMCEKLGQIAPFLFFGLFLVLVIKMMDQGAMKNN